MEINAFIRDVPAWEALLAAVRARQVAAQAGQQRHVQVKLLHQLVHVRPAVAAEHLKMEALKLSIYIVIIVIKIW